MASLAGIFSVCCCDHVLGVTTEKLPIQRMQLQQKLRIDGPIMVKCISAVPLPWTGTPRRRVTATAVNSSTPAIWLSACGGQHVIGK